MCAGASSGGHTNELMPLLAHAHLWPVQPSFYVTTLNILADKYAGKGRLYVLGECDRKKLLSVPGVIFRAFMCAAKERPGVVVTTGSMPLAVFCLWAKLFGARIVWIDSIANTNGLSMSGSLMRWVADLCLTQWPEVAACKKGVEYAGQLL